MTVRNSRVKELAEGPPVAEAATGIEYRRLRAPRQDGETLQVPPLSEARAVWQSNLAKRPPSGNFETVDAAALQSQARRELVEAARRHTGEYLDVELS